MLNKRIIYQSEGNRYSTCTENGFIDPLAFCFTLKCIIN